MTDPLARFREGLADRYVLERELGQGGMAVVYLAHDIRHDRAVAIKLMKPELSGAIGRDRFLREIQIAAQLSHPHILPLYDSGAVDDLLYYVMPLVEGESLRDRLERERQLGYEEALQITREVADALGFAHSRGVVHRDIKPENIMLAGGHALVTDFGIARAFDAAGRERLTQTGMAIGTPAYMSPEQWSGEQQIDGRSDLYSLGCVFYEMLVGEPPFTGPTPQAVMARASMEMPRSVRVVRPNVPPEVQQAIERALAKQPADRYATTSQFVRALSSTGTAHVVAKPAQRAAPVTFRLRLPSKKVMAATVLLVLVVIVGLLVRRPTGASAGRLRLVVLPFQNLGRPDAEYFADGLTEELTGRLASVAQLSVIGRTSSMQYKGTTKSVAQVGKELDVAFVLEGSVRWDRPANNRGQVRVSARLVKVSDGTQVWGLDYQVAMQEIFAVQSSIAERVAAALDVALAGTERLHVADRPTDNMDAYDAYLRGNSYYNGSWQRQDVEAALRLYQRATELDPRFAPAFARLAITRTWMKRLRFDESEDGLRAAQRAADSAIALNSGQADGHIAMGLYLYWGRWEYERAVDQFDLARRAQPGNADVYRNIGNVRRRQGLWKSAIESYQRAAELDPRSYIAWFNLGDTYLYTRQYDLAEPNLERVGALAPDFLDNYIAQASLAVNRSRDVEAARRIMRLAQERIPPATWRPLWGYWLNGFSRIFYPSVDDALQRLRPGSYGLDSGLYFQARAELLARSGQTAGARAAYESARQVIETQLARQPQPGADDAWRYGALAVAYAGLGRTPAALRAAQRAVDLSPVSRDAFEGPDWVMLRARVYLMVGDRDKAIEDLRFTLSVPSRMSANWLRLDPAWAPMLGDPRVRQLLSSGGSAGTAQVPAPPSESAPASPATRGRAGASGR